MPLPAGTPLTLQGPPLSLDLLGPHPPLRVLCSRLAIPLGSQQEDGLQTGRVYGRGAPRTRTSSPMSSHTQPSSRSGSERHASSPAEQVRGLWDPARIWVPDPSSSTRATVGFCAGTGFAVRGLLSHRARRVSDVSPAALAWAIRAKHHRPGGSSNGNRFLTDPEAGRPRPGGQRGRVLATGLFLAAFSLCPRVSGHGEGGECVFAILRLFLQVTNPSQGPHPLARSNPNHLPRTPPPNTNTPGVRAAA